MKTVIYNAVNSPQFAGHRPKPTRVTEEAERP